MSSLLVYRFQTKIKKGSTSATLIEFLKDRDGELTEKERVWWAVSAFWLPLAMQESGNYSQKEITKHALAAIQRLQEQITHLALTLDLEVPASLVHTLLSSGGSSSLGELKTMAGEGEVSDRLESEADFNSDFETEAEVQFNNTSLPVPNVSSNNGSVVDVFGY